MTSAQIRQSFLDFFKSKDHTIVPSSSLLPDSPNLLFTNAGMNQFVPIFLGQQKPPWKPPRTVDTQKCIRAGGKHNDLEDVGLDTYHHTFFEMLGNWSFGDYFKKEGIDWAWELVVGKWGLPAQRLYATVYKPESGEPSEFDQEAYDHWAEKFRNVDLDPRVHIVNGNKKDNFWMMGDTGPCGPCSELHIDLTPDGDTRGSLVNKDDPRCIEIWNLVFIQFNANPDGTFTPLPQRHVDTGMGFERVTAILQGTKNFTDFSGIISNYETDVFRPIFDEIERLSGKKYGSTLPIAGRLCETPSAADTAALQSTNEQIQIDIAFRVIADHIRTLSFAIADGIIPSNEGRGYVLRRILRRAVRYGRSLGFHQPFFFKLVDVVARTMGDVFPEVCANQPRIKETIQREEESFNKTLDAGINEFDRFAKAKESLQSRLYSRRRDFNESYCSNLENRELLSNEKLDELVDKQPTTWRGVSELLGNNSKLGTELNDRLWRYLADQIQIHVREYPTKVPGDVAFKLYDTYGFPLDLTELMARERGLTVDVSGFEQLMEEQRDRGRKAQKKETITIDEENLKGTTTEFLGYDFLEAEAVVDGLAPDERPGQLKIILDRTTCYAEMGGQVGDHGLIHVPGHDRTEVGQLRIDDTQKRGNVIVHRTTVTEGRAPEPGEAVRIAVDVDRRKAIQRHHTVTHVLHWALHELISRDATQKGSYVGPDKLTFDFSSSALSKDQVRDVETLVNEKISENAPVSWTEVPYAEAKKRRDIQQFFGEKYGDTVRVVQIGGKPEALDGYSMELCGGTHVQSTGDIEWFHVVREEAIAAGIRRIEAVAGGAVRDWAYQEAKKQQEKFEGLSRKKPGLAALPEFDSTVAPAKLLQQIERRSAHVAKLETEIHNWEKSQVKAAEADLQSRASTLAGELAQRCSGKPSCVTEIPNADGKLLIAVADVLKTKFAGPIFLAGAMNGRVSLLAVVPREMTTKIQASKLIQETAPIVNGKGGGRPESAQGGGTDPARIQEALNKADKILSG
jgi:alanyl-tRNA synthetase